MSYRVVFVHNILLILTSCHISCTECLLELLRNV